MGAAAQEVATRLVTFSSDYGTTDEFVGVVHLVIAKIAPDVRVIDLAHGIRGIRGGSIILAQSLPEGPSGAVHLAVVDPGVGTDRRGVVITCADGSFLVGPDNGIFFPVADRLGGAASANELADPRYRLEDVSSTFHGRDVFGPAVAHLALGVDATSFGPAIDPATLVRLPPAHVSAEPGRLESDVGRTDHYGNIQLAAIVDDLRATGLSGAVLVDGHRATVGEKFADVPEGELLVYVNSAGHVAIACNRGSARDVLGDPDLVTISGP